MTRRRVSIVPHTHWDREWFAPFQTFRLRLVDLLDNLLPMLEGDALGGPFLLDGQVAVVDDYLEIRPEAGTRVRRLVTSGRMSIGPWYTLPDEFCVSGETLVRNLQLGLARAAEFGGAMEVGYLPDMFGHCAQMPQLLKLAGMEQAVVWRGVPSAVDRTSFWWVSPDGSEVRTEYLWHGYGNGAWLPRDGRGLMQRVEAFVADVGPALVGDVLLMNGSDHQPPQAGLDQTVVDANDVSEQYEVVVTSLPEALAHSRSVADSLLEGADDLPRWQGELRSGARANLLMGVASNRVDLKQAAAAAERALERRAEPLAAFWLSADEWPDRLLDLAWLNMVRNAAHDSICGCSIDAVCDAVKHRYGEAHHIADGIAERALASLATNLALPGAIVVNPSARARGGTVELVVPGEGPLAGGQVLEERPTVITDRILSPGDARSWMLWFRSQRIDDSTYVSRAEIAESDQAISLTLHCDAGLTAPVLVEDVKAELRALMSERPDLPLHLRIVQPPSRRVLWSCPAIPGYGWTRWAPDQSPGPQDPPGHRGRPGCGVAPVALGLEGRSLANGLVTVSVDPGDATLSINGLEGLARLIDGGDLGDTYNYSPPDHDVVITAPTEVRVESVEGGPVRGKLSVRAWYCWPERIVDHHRVGEREAEVMTTVEVHAGEPFVRVSHQWVNRCRDHRLRALFPLPVVASSAKAECAYATVERPLHAEGGPTEKALATSFSRRFVQAGGLTVVHDGLLEYELTGRSGASLDTQSAGATALSLTILRCTAMLSRVDTTYRPLPAGPPIAMEGPQCQGPASARYAIAVDPATDPYAMADQVLVPLETVVSPGGGTVTDAQGQALSIQGAEVSAVVRDAEGRLVVRVFNSSRHPSTLTTRDQGGPIDGWVVDLRGRPDVRYHGAMTMRPWQIVTVRLAKS